MSEQPNLEHPENSVGKATHFTFREGGEWFPWSEGCADAGDMFAIKFSSGWIWDGIVGWRQS